MRLALGVGGGIAAYKAAELVRLLQQNGHSVQVIMTEAAQQFITPLTFAALTGEKVITGLFAQDNPESALASAVEHVAVAKEHDVLVVAPATANLLSQFAHGAATDFLSTMQLVFRGPTILAPAMNDLMWTHPAVQANVAMLRARGCTIVEPEEGWLACGTVGAGRLADPDRIVRAVERIAHPRKDLEGETVLITAGPTQELVDPVRYLSNRSSGKMGYAIAQEAVSRGARVILISGPVSIPPPEGAEVIQVRTAVEMREAVMAALPVATVIIKSAAVADYYVTPVPQQKMKKTAARVSLELSPTPDILAELGRVKGERLLIGFAAETENLIEEARRKMRTKNCDMVVANLVNQEGAGFESDHNQVTILNRSGQVLPVGPASKAEIAVAILDQVLSLRLHVHSEQTPVFAR